MEFYRNECLLYVSVCVNFSAYKNVYLLLTLCRLWENSGTTWRSAHPLYSAISIIFLTGGPGTDPLLDSCPPLHCRVLVSLFVRGLG